MAELVKSKNRVNELEVLTEDFSKQLSQKQAKIDELTAELANVDEKKQSDFD